MTMLLGEQQVLQVAQRISTPLSNQGALFELYAGLSMPERTGLFFFSTIVLGAVVLGLLPGFTERTVRTARRSPIISVLIGIPGSVALGALLYTGQLLSHSDVGIFFGIPFVTAGLALLPTLTVIGVVAVGESLATRLGRGGFVSGLVIGALLVGLLAVATELIAVVGPLLVCLGVGAGMRVLVTGGTVTDPSDRKVPPANKI